MMSYAYDAGFWVSAMMNSGVEEEIEALVSNLVAGLGNVQCPADTKLSGRSCHDIVRP